MILTLIWPNIRSPVNVGSTWITISSFNTGDTLAGVRLMIDAGLESTFTVSELSDKPLIVKVTVSAELGATNSVVSQVI